MIKKLKFFMVITIFVLAFPIHFMYELFPNFIISIFFPVNESIWEHMKLLFSSIIFNGIIEHFIIKKYKLKINNFLFSLFSSAIISIPVFLTIYLPIYNTIGENMFINLFFMLIAIIISQITSYYIEKTDNIKYINIISLILIIICYIIFGYLTYYPIFNELFFDPLKEKYGINYFILLMRNL